MLFFFNIVGSLFLKDPFPRLFRGRNSCRCAAWSWFLPVHRYSVDVFSYSGPSGILGSDRKQITALGV